MSETAELTWTTLVSITAGHHLLCHGPIGFVTKGLYLELEAPKWKSFSKIAAILPLKQNASGGHACLNGSGCRSLKALCYLLWQLTIFPRTETGCGGGHGIFYSS